MHDAFVALIKEKLHIVFKHCAARNLLTFSVLAVSFLLLSCKSQPDSTTATTKPANQDGPAQRRPTPPPPFHLYHQTNDTLTLVTTPNATNDQIAAILYQLRDAAVTHTFDTLHLPQKFIDARSPIVWFHIYRGPRCADEKYTTGKLPCGASYHAAADFTYGSFHNPNRTDGDLVIDQNHSTELWNPDAKIQVAK
jgi:hypothetical protein